MAYTLADLEAMDRNSLKVILDEKGIEYSRHAQTTTLISMILESEGADVSDVQAEEAAPEEEVTPHVHPPAEDPAVASTEVAVREGEEVQEEAPFYQPQVLHPWELPANTAVAQQYVQSGAVLVDESIEVPEERMAAANNEIELYGHPEDPRLSGGSLVTDPLPLEKLGAPPARQIDPVPPEDPNKFETILQRAQREQAESEGEADVEKVEEKV